jgi:transposase InsO family protein
MHPNARLTPIGRNRLLALYAEGYTQAVIATTTGVSRPTVSKWIRRVQSEGTAGLLDRPSRPHTSPTRVQPEREEAICARRIERADGPQRLAAEFGMPASTVYAVLCRYQLNQLRRLDRTTREVIRYERSRPGELLHIDTKKLGRIPDGGGKRMEPGFAETGIGRQSNRRQGYDLLYVAIDDYSRYTYIEALDDEKKETAAAFLARATHAFAAFGVTIERVLTDNALSYRSHIFQETAERLGIGLRRTRPYRPQTNGKTERVIQTTLREWAYRRPYYTNAERLQQLPVFLEEYNWHRPHSVLGHKPPITRIMQQRP